MHCDREPLSKLQRALVALIPPRQGGSQRLGLPEGPSVHCLSFFGFLVLFAVDRNHARRRSITWSPLRAPTQQSTDS